MNGKTPFPVPSGIRVLLKCQNFSNRLNKTMAACLEDSQGVSAHLVRLLEDEWASTHRLIVPGRAGRQPTSLSNCLARLISVDDLERLNVLLVQLEIQQFYMLPIPGYDQETLKNDILRAYNTAQTIVKDMVKLDSKTDFLLYAPHFYFRALICAACTICKVIRSSYKNLVSWGEVGRFTDDIIFMIKKSIIMEGDLASRLVNILEPWLELAHGQEWNEEPVSSFTQRLSAGPTLDCLWRWKHDQENLINAKGQVPPPDGTDGSAAMANTDPMQFIDWSFMNDFDWNLGPVIESNGAY